MGLFNANFKDVVMKNQYIDCQIKMSRFGWRFKQAQIWLEKAFFDKMKPVVPYRTGQFLSKLEAANAANRGMGQVIASVPPQGRRLYNGINLNTGMPYRWTNPLTQPRWGSWVVQTYGKELKKGVTKILLTGKEWN